MITHIAPEKKTEKARNRQEEAPPYKERLREKITPTYDAQGVPLYSDEWEVRHGYGRKTNLSEEQLVARKKGFLEPLRKDKRLFIECLKREELTESVMDDLIFRMQELPDEIRDRTPESYRPFNEITEALEKMGRPEERIRELFSIAVESSRGQSRLRIGESFSCEDDEADYHARLLASARGVYLALVPNDVMTFRVCYQACVNDFRALRHVPRDLRDERVYQAARIGLWREIGEKRKYSYRKYDWSDVDLFFDELPYAYQEKWLKELKRWLKRDHVKEWSERKREADVSLKGQYLALFRKIEETIRLNGDGRDIMRFEPTASVSRELVKNYQNCLQCLPKITKELCLLAIEKDPHALRHVPETIMDRDLVVRAVSRDGLALRHVPEKFRNRDLEETALHSNPDAWILLEPVEEEIVRRKRREDRIARDKFFEEKREKEIEEETRRLKLGREILDDMRRTEELASGDPAPDFSRRRPPNATGMWI